MVRESRQRDNFSFWCAVYKCGESGLVIQECGSSGGGRAYIRLFKLK